MTEEPIVVPVARELYLPIVRARTLLEEARKTVEEAERNFRVQMDALFDTVAPGIVKEYKERQLRSGISQAVLPSRHYVGELTGDGRFMVFRIV
jgi:hypothetical protein